MRGLIGNLRIKTYLVNQSPAETCQVFGKNVSGQLYGGVMRKISLLVILVLLSLAACSGNDKSALKISDPQLPIEVSAGQEFSIVLEANPTTGYHWAIVGELDLSVVKVVKNEYISTSAPNLVGGGGVEVWTFKAGNAGQAQITLGYYPPSNDPTEPQQKEVFTVTVK
jgi:inhibitor of cysteine peptidase